MKTFVSALMSTLPRAQVQAGTQAARANGAATFGALDDQAGVAAVGPARG